MTPSSPNPPPKPKPEPLLPALWRFLRANPLLLALIIAVFGGMFILGGLAAREAAELGMWDVPADAPVKEVK